MADGFTNGERMVRIHFAVDLRYDVQSSPGADFVFNFQAARTRQQTVVHEDLLVNPCLDTASHTDAFTHTRLLRLRAAPGPLQVRYSATVDISHHAVPPLGVQETPVAHLPSEVLVYLYPSRYCQSDLFTAQALALFGAMPQGYGRVLAIRDWVRSQVEFRSLTSNSMTSALDTLNTHVGVCRDFAHLMIAMCRALNIPARFTTAIDFGADPALGPTDFHAYVEVYLDHRWYLFDPSGTAIPMGFVRIGTGRDAADVAFATIFGTVQSQPPRIDVSAQSGAPGNWRYPVHREEALSTDAMFAWNEVNDA